jgi:hypothetical protein
MEYRFVDVGELKRLYDGKFIHQELMATNHCWNNNDVEKVYVYGCFDVKDPNIVYGLCVGTVYKKNTICRCSQWKFGENRQRELWIEYLSTNSESNCHGNTLLAEIEKKLVKHDVVRRNIYIVSLFHAVGFYEKCGYQEIVTSDSDEDDDYPSSFVHGAGIGTWMSKGIDGKLDNENVYEPIFECLFGEAYERNLVRLIRPYLTFEVDITFLYFLYPKNYEEFQKDTGRKFLSMTFDEFKDVHFRKYKDFFNSVDKYESSGDTEVFTFFKSVNLEIAKRMLENYLDSRS